jgi:hypothetical protein
MDNSYSALSLIKQMPENKAQIKTFVNSVKDEILLGWNNPLELDLRLKIMEEIIKAIRKDEEIQEAVILEADKYQEKTINIYGCEVQKRNATTYDYSTCNDYVLEDLQKKADEASKELKERQEFLKHLKTPVYNPESGTMIEPPLCKQKQSIAVKIL